MTWALSDVEPLVNAAWALIEGDDPCPSCHAEVGEDGLCSEPCPRYRLLVALEPFEDDYFGQPGKKQEADR